MRESEGTNVWQGITVSFCAQQQAKEAQWHRCTKEGQTSETNDTWRVSNKSEKGRVRQRKQAKYLQGAEMEKKTEKQKVGEEVDRCGREFVRESERSDHRTQLLQYLLLL